MLLLYTGIIKTAFRTETTTSDISYDPSYNLKIVAFDSFDPQSGSDPVELFIRISHKPAITITDTAIGAFQFETTINIGDFAHLREVQQLEVTVQQYHPQNSLRKCVQLSHLIWIS